MRWSTSVLGVVDIVGAVAVTGGLVFVCGCSGVEGRGRMVMVMKGEGRYAGIGFIGPGKRFVLFAWFILNGC